MILLAQLAELVK